MPRSARAKSETGIYHVMLRGIDRSQLFYEVEDYQTFKSCLLRFKHKLGFTLYCYSLMGNHVHLLIKEGDEGLSEEIRRIASSYAYWFNSKYDRRGYVFEGRYKSEAVGTDAYLLQVLRYILNNPVKIGLPINDWTNYSDFFTEDEPGETITDTSFVLEMFSSDPQRARELFVEFLEEDPGAAQAFLDEAQRKPNDSEAMEIIKRVTHVSSCSNLTCMEKDERDHTLALLKSEGLSVRTLARLTGINRGVVQKAKLA